MSDFKGADNIDMEHDPAHMEAFTFGDPVPVLDQRQLLYFGECSPLDRYYSLPFDPEALALTMQATSHHASPIYVKRNILAGTFIPSPFLSQLQFTKLAQDFLVFGNAYIQKINAVSGKLFGLQVQLAKYMRVGVEPGSFYFVNAYNAEDYEFAKDSIVHILEPDINQEIYGAPQYLSALNAVFLDEAATLFRRKYYKNGSHAGFIMYVTDPAQNQGDIDAMRQALRDSKGPGNFRNLFLYSPNGKPDGIKIIPISEVSARDDFLNIKASSRTDIAAAHRVPPQLMGAMPDNVGGFGDVEKAARVFVINELQPLQQRLIELNDMLGVEVIRFKPYALETVLAAAKP